MEDLGGGGPAHGVGHIMVADEEKDGDAGARKAVDAPGELPLLGLGRLAGLIGVPAEKDEVDMVFQGEVDELVEGGQEIGQAGGKAGGGVDATVVLDAEVQVGEMDDLHFTHSNRFWPAG